MYRAIAKNKRNTVLIILVFLLIIAALGFLAEMIWGGNWFIFTGTLIGALIYVIIQYFAGSRQALQMSGARPISLQDDPRLYRIVQNLAITEGLPMPKVYIVEDPAPNAFAAGRDPEHAVVAATTGLLEIMDDAELEGVMAHEIGHVKNHDIRVTTIVFALVVAIGFLADILLRMTFFGGRGRNNSNPLMIVLGLVAIILAPIAAAAVQAAVSRQREYLADASAALTTRHPEALARALTKLSQYGRPMQRQHAATAHLWISDPTKPGLMDRMFSTHPPIDKRVERLRAIGGGF